MLADIIKPADTDEEMFVSYIDKIRKEVERAADNWLHIAYYVYELNFFGYYKNHFDNIVDCCLANFGFKKSTTYNFINIVEQFSVKQAFTVGMVKSKPIAQYVGWNDFFIAVKSWSYSQLVAMLSLSDKQREQATPEMSAREIKRLKTDSKRLESDIDVPEAVSVEIAAPAESAPVVAESASKRLESDIVVSEAVSVEIAAPTESEPVVADYASTESVINHSHEIDELQQALDIALDDVSNLSVKYDSKCRELNDMIIARDEALQDIEKIKEQVKKLKAENKKLKAEIKALKSS